MSHPWNWDPSLRTFVQGDTEHKGPASISIRGIADWHIYQRKVWLPGFQIICKCIFQNIHRRPRLWDHIEVNVMDFEIDWDRSDDAWLRLAEWRGNRNNGVDNKSNDNKTKTKTQIAITIITTTTTTRKNNVNCFMDTLSVWKGIPIFKNNTTNKKKYPNRRTKKQNSRSRGHDSARHCTKWHGDGSQFCPMVSLLICKSSKTK